MRYRSAAILLALLVARPARTAEPERWVPEHCTAYRSGSDDDVRWNDAYGRGFGAIGRGEYDVAEREMCRALLAVRTSGARDWRFAETLDELGLIAYQMRDFDLAERMQGAAIAEMLLAAGPQGEPLSDREIAGSPTIRPDCASGVRAYTTRLGWIHEKISARVSTDAVQREPWRIFAAGFVPLNTDLADRLDWLVSQYLLQENLAAAEALSELRREILSE